ncbi:MAG: DNA/RNA non-specific endonuclease [Polaromonas sp.]|jgi:endonuclease G|nr:DNA/RNA non-specific endonuclease [Polaromonas sp.]
MKKRKSPPGSRARNKPHLISTLLVLFLGLSCHSCTELPAGRELVAAGVGLETLLKGLGTAAREYSGTPAAASESVSVPRPGYASEYFSACRNFFVNGKPPVVAPRPGNRALCYDAFAILHSGDSKTAVFVAEKLNRASVVDADEERTDRFFADARLRSAERATLADYKGSGFDRGHLAPAGDMPTAQAMAQSFSLANMVPQAPKHNQGAWRTSVEAATKKYAGRASGDVYVITGPVFVPSIAQSPGIGPGHVRVPRYLFKLVYDQDKNRAWAHWNLNDNATRASQPISYGELVRRTGIVFLPGINPAD